MRVLFLNPSGHLGGAEIALLDILASLRSAVPEWELGLISPGYGLLAEYALQLGVACQTIDFPASFARLGDAGAGGPAGDRINKLALLARMFAAVPGVAAYSNSLRRAISNFAPDVIHTNGFKMHVLGIVAKPADTPVLWHIHDYVTMRPVMSILLKRLAGRCSGAVANSHSTAQDLSSQCQGRGLRIHTVHNAVNLERFSPEGSKADLDSLAGFDAPPPGTVRIGMIATLARWKGHEIFMQALSRLSAEIPYRAYIIGGPVYRTTGSQCELDELRGLSVQLGIADRVAFTGYMSEPAAAMRALDIVVHASTQPEPFGLVIAEGMACGRAVIASRGGGAAEILTMGPGPIGFTTGNIAELAQAMELLASSSELRARLGREARDTAERLFDRRRLALDLIPIYDQAASKSISQLTGGRANCQA